jgi:hypothetical protein
MNEVQNSHTNCIPLNDIVPADIPNDTQRHSKRHTNDILIDLGESHTNDIPNDISNDIQRHAR